MTAAKAGTMTPRHRRLMTEFDARLQHCLRECHTKASATCTGNAKLTNPTKAGTPAKSTVLCHPSYTSVTRAAAQRHEPAPITASARALCWPSLHKTSQRYAHRDTPTVIALTSKLTTSLPTENTEHSCWVWGASRKDSGSVTSCPTRRQEKWSPAQHIVCQTVTSVSQLTPAYPGGQVHT